MMMSRYENMLPKEPKQGKQGYYPVTSKEEWEELPALYKAMDWFPVKDCLNGGRMRAVKAVIFDVTYMEPYKISARVSVHPQEIQRILYCLYNNSQCHLYSICGIELEGGTVLGAKWLQDSVTGAFGIVCGGATVAKQGGYCGYVPKSITAKEDGSYEPNWGGHHEGVISHYTFYNPFK